MSGYTFGEKFSFARHLVQGGRRAHLGLGTDKHDTGIDRIKNRRAERDYRDAVAAEALAEQARAAASTAKAAWNGASRQERSAAKQALQRAEQGLRRAESAARKYR